MTQAFRIQTLSPAENPTALSAWLLEQAKQLTDYTLYALVDGGQIENIPTRLARMAPQNAWPLFGPLGNKDLEPVGGWLVHLGTNPPTTCMDWLCQEAMTHPTVMWFQSPLDHHDMLSLLAPRLNAKLEERGIQAVLRYYDPRIFTNLVEVLKPEQTPYLSMAPRWYWFDHALKRRILEMPVDVEAARRFEHPITFDPAQEKALIDKSIPYEMMAIFEQEEPEPLEAVPRNERYGLMKQGVDKAIAKGHRGLHDMFLACVETLSARQGQNRVP